MNCHGKCQMMKKMKEQEKNEKGPTSSTKEKQETIQFFKKNSSFTFNTYTESKIYNSFYLIRKTKSVSFSVFHPPTV